MALFLGCATFCTAVARAQDQQNQSVAEAARQERARKQQLRQRASHVYTGDDLKRAHILTPQDRAIVDVKRNECAQKNDCAFATSQNSQNSLNANSQPQQPSLGEVARRLRKQKELQALEPKQSEPFHLSIGSPVLASPILPERPALRFPVGPLHRRKSSRSESHANIVRRDPFSAVPVSPEIRSPEVPRAEIRSSVPEDSHSELHRNVRASDRQGISARSRLTGSSGLSPSVTPEVRERILPTSGRNIHPDFTRSVRPEIPIRRRAAIVALPQISSLPAAHGGLIQPMRPSSPPKPAEPGAPVVSPNSTPPRFTSEPSGILSHETVRVQPGDSLWKLALQSLGRGSRWPELLAINRTIRNPNQIRVGTQLYLPVPARQEAVGHLRPSAAPRAASRITVRNGDTLWSLAKAVFGRAAYWPCLAAANPAVTDPNIIFNGEKLNVPTGCGPLQSMDSRR